MDLLTVIGLILALLAIVGGQVLEGGHLSSIIQPTAALIVFGGTIAALFVQYSISSVTNSIKLAFGTLASPKDNLEDNRAIIIDLARFAQKEGLLALEKRMHEIDDPFFRRALQLLVDGATEEDIRSILDLEIGISEERDLLAARVFDSAGGYAPTLGILGAVLGLIQVMENLADPTLLGEGIAIAFVATVYGVASANLLWLPIAGKIKSRCLNRSMQKEFIVEGLANFSAGKSPRIIADHLESYLLGSNSGYNSERG